MRAYLLLQVVWFLHRLRNVWLVFFMIFIILVLVTFDSPIPINGESMKLNLKMTNFFYTQTDVIVSDQNDVENVVSIFLAAERRLFVLLDFRIYKFKCIFCFRKTKCTQRHNLTLCLRTPLHINSHTCLSSKLIRSNERHFHRGKTETIAFHFVNYNANGEQENQHETNENMRRKIDL